MLGAIKHYQKTIEHDKTFKNFVPSQLLYNSASVIPDCIILTVPSEL